MNQKLKHNEIVFRVLLQREDVRPALTFATLEEVVPKPIRKLLENDWRSYIRDEGLDFDIAFQKTVRKNIPGLHYIVLAAEFLGKMPFHTVLGHFLQPDKFSWNSATVSEDEVFKLADRLEDEFREKRARLIPPQRIVFSPPKPTPRPSVPTRKCFFCRKQIPAAELYQHIDSLHLNPTCLGGMNNQPKNTSMPMSGSNQITYITDQPASVVTSPSNEFGQFRRPRCACGNVAIPGDFYCYHCAPD